jgi:hypothetical protein
MAETITSLPNQLFAIYGKIQLLADVKPEYEKTYDKHAADKLDGQVFDSMNKA